MISQTPEQQQLDDARLKFQLDEAARLEFARTEGIREGKARAYASAYAEGFAEGLRIGEMIGQIKLLRKLLGISNPPSEELSSYDMVELSELAEQLKAQFRRRSC